MVCFFPHCWLREGCKHFCHLFQLLPKQIKGEPKIFFKKRTLDLLLTWYEEGSDSAPSSNLGPPSKSGLQGPAFQPLNITYDPLKQSHWGDG